MRDERWHPSQVPPERALRAREVSRPSEEDRAEAERTVVLRFAKPVAEAAPRSKGGRPRRP